MPQAHVLNDKPFYAIRWALTTMVFISCLSIHLKDLKPKKEHIFLLVLNFLMGVVPYFLFRYFCPEHPELAKAAFFVGITPTATAAPVVISFLNGRIGFALTGFTITNVGISITLVGLLPMVAGQFTLDFIGHVCVTLLQVIALPFVAAYLLRLVWKKAEELPKKLKTFSFLLWSFTLFILAAIARQFFIDNPHVSLWNVGAIAVISCLICAANFYLGKCIAPKRFKRECSQLLGQKNTTFTMYLALQYASPLVAMGPIFYIFWHNMWNAFQMYEYDLRKTKRAEQRVELEEQAHKDVA